MAARIARSRSVSLLACAPVLALLVLTGCSKAPEKSAAPPPTASSTAPASSAKPTPTVRQTHVGTPTLGGECDQLLPVDVVDTALGRPVIGKTAFIRGVAEPDIGRLTYLNCRYGLGTAAKGKPAPAPQVEIGVSLYSSAAQASRRVQGTVEDYRSHGSSQQDVVIGRTKGTVLIGYGSPIVVVAEGPRTAAITVNAKLIAQAPSSGLTALAQAVLVATSHFDGVPGVVATPSPTGSQTDSGDPSDGSQPSNSASPSDTP